MLPWLLEHFGSTGSDGEHPTWITLRIALAALTSFVAAVALGPTAIRWLQGRFRERIDSGSERLNELHAGKQNTPTMGGLFVSAAVLMALVVWGDWSRSYLRIAAFMIVTFTALGACDDVIKLRSRRRGLSARQKMIGQLLLAAISVVWLSSLRETNPDAASWFSPWSGNRVPLGMAFIPWGMFVIVGTSNAVNLTDGLDGLAAGCTITTATAFTAITYFCGHRVLAQDLAIPHMTGCGELAVVLGALIGSLLGFLWFNCYPAAVFMGDAGSLPLGALLALAALATRQEVLLVLIGAVFVAETLSVILQVASFKLTGRRIFACAPLHHHFVFRGTSEQQVVVRFWIVSVLTAVLGIACLKLRS